MIQEGSPLNERPARQLSWADARLRDAILEAADPEKDWEIIQKVANDWDLPPDIVLSASLRFEREKSKAKRLAGSVVVKVLFAAPKSRREHGRVGKLTMRLHTVKGRPIERMFVPNERMLWVKDSIFLGAFNTALKAVLSLDPANQIEIEDEDLVVEWDIELPGAADLPRQLTGKSLGGAIAIGLLRLLVPSVPKEHKCYPYLNGLTALFHNPDWGMTAEINEDGHLFWPLHVENKLRSPGCPDTVYVGARDPGQATGMEGVIPVYDLTSFLQRLGEKEGMPGSPRATAKDPVARWGMWALAVVLSVWVASPLFIEKPRPLQEIEVAHLDSLLLPTGCKQIVQIKKTFTQHEWDTVILPSLQKQMYPFALILGDAEEWTKQPYLSDPVSLTGIADLQLLHTLTLHPSNIIEIPEIENMIYLERLALFGSCVMSLGDCSKLQNLRTLVIDSGFLEDYPKEYAFPNLETLVLQVSADIETLDFSKCLSLKRLCVCGENLEEIKGLEDLPLTDLSIYALNLIPGAPRPEESIIESEQVDSSEAAESPNVKTPQGKDTEVPSVRPRTIGTVLPISLKRLELHRTADIDIVDASELEELELDQVSVSRLESHGYQGLKKIDISQASELRAIDLKPFGALEELTIGASPLQKITSLEHCQNLQTLDLNDTEISDLPKLTALKKLGFLFARNTKLNHLPQLGVDGSCTLVWEGTPLEKRLNALWKKYGISKAKVEWSKIDDGPAGYSIELENRSFRRLSESPTGELVLGDTEAHRPINGEWSEWTSSGWGGDSPFTRSTHTKSDGWNGDAIKGVYSRGNTFAPAEYLEGGHEFPSQWGGSRWIGYGVIVFTADDGSYQFLDNHGWPVQSAYWPEYQQFNSRSVISQFAWNIESDLGLEAIRQKNDDSERPRVSPFKRGFADESEETKATPMKESAPSSEETELRPEERPADKGSANETPANKSSRD